jgi:hypothetical protein
VEAEETRARICKCLRIPGIDSQESILPAYVAWRAGTSNRVVVPARQAGNRFLGSLKVYKFGLRQTFNCKILKMQPNFYVDIYLEIFVIYYRHTLYKYPLASRYRLSEHPVPNPKSSFGS